MDDIWDYIVAELQNPVADGKVIDRIMETVDALESFPSQAPPFPPPTRTGISAAWSAAAT